MLETAFTRLTGCRVPIQSAPMGQISTVQLAAAVAAAGGHPMLSVANAPQPVVAAMLDQAAAAGLTAFGVNFLVPFANDEIVRYVAGRVPLVDFYLGPPDRYLAQVVHEAGALAGWQVTSLAEAHAAVEAGCDVIVAHGIEAGGRIPGGIGLFPLLEQVLPEVSVPVVAAGGIATGRGVAAALAAGASAVRLGTRFIAATESGAHPLYVEKLVAATAEDTTWTQAFFQMLPPHLAGARVLRASLAAAEALTAEHVGQMPLGDQMLDIPRFGAPPPTIGMTGTIEAMPMYAGESAGATRDVRSAADLVASIAAEAERLLMAWAPTAARA